jgi:hypothetical protein
VSVGPRLHRRSALALAAAGAVAVAGCDDDPTPTPLATPTADPDVALVDRVLVQLRGAERVARAAGEADLAALHRAHIAALDGTPPTGSPALKTAPGAVGTREKRLQQHLADAALQARSGALARLLASMSAAVSQRLAARPA